jgi:uncharacterized protein (TIGR03086 family)
MMTDRRSALIRSYDTAAGVLSNIDPGQLSAPTPCPKFDVAALVDHIVGAGFRAAELGEGKQPAGDEFPHVDLSDAAGELRRAAKQAEAAWSDDSSLTRTVTMPWGEVYTGETLVNMYLAEIATHAWDLASATGQMSRLDSAVTREALEGARAMLKPEYRNLMEPGSPFGSEVEAPSDATDWEALAAFMGRQPR